MPKQTALASMRTTRTLESSLCLSADMAKAAEFHLNRLEQLARCTATLEALKKAIEDECAAYAVRRRDLLAQDFQRQRDIEAMRFTDETEE